MRYCSCQLFRVGNMQCLTCESKAVLISPQFCVNHFSDWFEEIAKQTILQDALIDKNIKVGVAVSGGKDSMTLLFVLNKLGYNVVALSVDEGIKGYRDRSLLIVKEYCSKNNIKLAVKSFVGEFGHTLDDAKKQFKGIPCRLCGAWRRSILNDLAQRCDVIATGHNLDDEAQSVFMNMIHNQSNLNARVGPKVGFQQQIGFVQRVKPFFWLSEQQIKAYAFLHQIPLDVAECPNAFLSFRAKVRDMLNRADPLLKYKLVMHALKQHAEMAILKKCNSCGLPCSADQCRSCIIKEALV